MKVSEIDARTRCVGTGHPCTFGTRRAAKCLLVGVIPCIPFLFLGQNTGRVLCAAGDGNAYEWDMRSLGSAAATAVPVPGVGVGAIDQTQTPVQTYRGNRGYLLAVAVSLCFVCFFHLIARVVQ